MEQKKTSGDFDFCVFCELFCVFVSAFHFRRFVLVFVRIELQFARAVPPPRHFVLLASPERVARLLLPIIAIARNWSVDEFVIELWISDRQLPQRDAAD